MTAKKLYVIGNSHMDPIWLWRLREGRSTWLNTCRSVVRLMKKYPFLRFCRSSSVCYEWIEQCAPDLFAEIGDLIRGERWEIIGGWVEQSDTIITPGEILIRQAEYGKRYFREKFGRDVSIGYSVDAFGQNAGLPKILNHCGFNRYVFMRPMEHEKSMPHLFRWRDGRGCEVTALRVRKSYCTSTGWRDKQELFDWMDKLIAEGDAHQTFFFGIGDHGGGIYEKQLEWLLEASEVRDIEFSTLAHYFDEIEKNELPVYEGELTHHAPGCYSAVSTIKRQLADTGQALAKAEKLVLEHPGPDGPEDSRKLDAAWNDFLFNYFHDVYPGTAVKKAYDGEVRDLTGHAGWIAASILEKRLGRYANRVRSDFLTEGGILLWNPLPVPVRGIFRFDTFSDPNNNGRCFNALYDENGSVLPLQWLQAAASYGPCENAWGQAAGVVDLPPSGLRIFAYGYSDTEKVGPGFAKQHTLLERISFPVIADAGDAWGHDMTRLGTTAGFAGQTGVEELENGPVVSRLRANYCWKNSTFTLDLYAYAGIPELFTRWRADWREKGETIKLSLKTGISAGTIVSGQAATVISRPPDDCEQPFIGFAASSNGRRATGFISSSLHGYDSFGTGELRLTLNRPVIYADHRPYAPHGEEGCADLGDVEQEFWIADEADTNRLPALARERLWTIEHLEITAASGGGAFPRDEWRIEPPEVITLIQNNRGFQLWNTLPERTRYRIFRNGTEIAAGTLNPEEIRYIPMMKKSTVTP